MVTLLPANELTLDLSKILSFEKGLNVFGALRTPCIFQQYLTVLQHLFIFSAHVQMVTYNLHNVLSKLPSSFPKYHNAKQDVFVKHNAIAKGLFLRKPESFGY